MTKIKNNKEIRIRVGKRIWKRKYEKEEEEKIRREGNEKNRTERSGR